MRIPSIPSLLPRLTYSAQIPAIPAITSSSTRPPDVVLCADTLPVLVPFHVARMFPLCCPARAEMPGIVLCLALHAPAKLALGPLSLLLAVPVLPGVGRPLFLASDFLFFCSAYFCSQ